MRVEGQPEQAYDEPSDAESTGQPVAGGRRLRVPLARGVPRRAALFGSRAAPDCARQGGGGDYLSNESAYRNTLLRDVFAYDPDVAIAVCSLTAAGVGLNLQVASNIVLAELSWTDAEQTQAIDRSHRIGQAEPVTAWRIIAAQTIDARIAELIDSKAGLAARALSSFFIKGNLTARYQWTIGEMGAHGVFSAEGDD